MGGRPATLSVRALKVPDAAGAAVAELKRERRGRAIGSNILEKTAILGRDEVEIVPADVRLEGYTWLYTFHRSVSLMVLLDVDSQHVVDNLALTLENPVSKPD
jgi:hypothetical protein